MSTNITKLLSISSGLICEEKPSFSQEINGLLGSLSQDLYKILTAKNGFYAFESALHVFPANFVCKEMELGKWNSLELWRSNYESSMGEYLFFAEDIFGNQFLIFNEKIYTFEPETGEIEEIAKNLEEWAKCILDDYNFFTGFQLAHEWQINNGVIPTGKRLIPKIPFVLGGKYTVDNLYLLDAATGMNLRADLAKQIINLKDGEKIKFHIID
jgi:hypothetical protein